MTRNEMLAQVRDAVAKCGPLDEPPTDDQPLFYEAATESSDIARARGEYGLDSLDRVEISIDLEERFNVDLPDADMSIERFNTVAQITDLLMSKI